MALPIVAGSEVSTPSSGVQMDPRAFRQEALMRGRVGEAAGDSIGDFFQTVTKQIVDARDTKKILDADLALAGTKNQFLNDIQKVPELARNPETWVPEFTKRFEETKGQLLSQPNLSRAVKRHLQEMTTNFGIQHTSEVQYQALHREANDLEQSGVSVMHHAAEDGDQSKYIAAAKSLGDAGIWGQKTVAQKLSMWPELDAKARIDSIFISNREHAPQAIEPFLKSLPPDKAKSAVATAKKVQDTAWSENFTTMIREHTDRDTGQVPKEYIQEQVDAVMINPKTGGALINSQQRATDAADRAAKVTLAKEDRDVKNSIMARVQDSLRWEGGPAAYKNELETAAASMTNATDRQNVLDEIGKHFDAVIKGEERNPELKRAVDMMYEDREKMATFAPLLSEVDKSHWFKPDEMKLAHYTGTLAEMRKELAAMSEEEIAAKFGKGKTRQSVLATEQSNFEKKVNAMTNWYKEQITTGKKPSVDEIEDKRQKLEGEDITGNIANFLK